MREGRSSSVCLRMEGRKDLPLAFPGEREGSGWWGVTEGSDGSRVHGGSWQRYKHSIWSLQPEFESWLRLSSP